MALPKCYRCQVRSLDCRYQTLVSTRILHTDQESAREDVLAPSTDCNELPLDSTVIDSPPKDDFGMSTDLSLPLPYQDLDWWDAMANIGSFAVPDHLEVNDAPSRSVMSGQKYQQRIVYAVQRVKLLPVLFATTGQTIFIHHGLYNTYLPSTLGDTMALCALYNRKSEANQSTVYRIISQHACRLLDGLDWLGSSPLDFLASVQALTLLQIIRLFDGDIRQRADAERAQPVLVNNIKLLQQRMQMIGDDWRHELTQGNRPDGWNEWLYAESLRRTVVVGFTLQGLYCFLKNGWDDSHHEFDQLSFYGQRALWLATSKFHWQAAIDNKNALPVRFSSWDTDVTNASHDDFDDLGVIMMALIKGVDHCCQWVGIQSLESFGLQQA